MAGCQKIKDEKPSQTFVYTFLHLYIPDWDYPVLVIGKELARSGIAAGVSHRVDWRRVNRARIWHVEYFAQFSSQGELRLDQA